MMLGDMQESMRKKSLHEVFPVRIGQNGDDDHCFVSDHNMVENGKSSPSYEDEQNFNGEEMDVEIDQNQGKKFPFWHRVKWADSMVVLLITAVSYISEGGVSEGSFRSRRQKMHLQKKGKWKLVSGVMAERGFYVSPQQCEDKFNDLNKRYKKLNEILGRGTSCQVVEKPALLDKMGHLSEKMKDEVRKILSSKHLFYEEMCSYHNGNRLHLPHDPELRRSLKLVLRGGDDNGYDLEDFDEDDCDVEVEDYEEYQEDHGKNSVGIFEDSSKTKRMNNGQSFDEICFGNPQASKGFNSNFHFPSHNPNVDLHLGLPEGKEAMWLQERRFSSYTLELKEHKRQIKLETLELEKEQLKWEQVCKRKERELEKLKIENERMKLENERLALELKQMEMNMNMKCSESDY